MSKWAPKATKWVVKQDPAKKDEEAEDKPKKDEVEEKKGKGGKKAEKAAEKATRKGDDNGGKEGKKGKGEGKEGKGEKANGKADGKADGKGKGDKGKAESKGKGEGKDSGKADGKGKGDTKGYDKGGGKSWNAEKGDKGKGKDKGADKGKGKGAKGKGKDIAGVWSVQQVESTLGSQAYTGAPPAVTAKRANPDAAGKQAQEAKGELCQVKKHSGMGCAVVTLNSQALKTLVLNYVQSRSAPGGSVQLDINGVTVQIKPHKPKGSAEEVPNEIFAGWGHKAEKESPLSADEVADAFDQVAKQAQAQPGATLATSPPAAPQVGARPPVVAPPPQYPAVPSMTPQQQAQLLAQQQQAAILQQQQQAAYYNYGYMMQQYQAQLAHQQAAAHAAAVAQAGAAAGGAPAGYAPQKPKTLKIINPESGNALDTLGLTEFAPAKKKTPLAIVDPTTNKEVSVTSS